MTKPEPTNDQAAQAFQDSADNVLAVVAVAIQDHTGLPLTKCTGIARDLLIRLVADKQNWADLQRLLNFYDNL